MPGEIAGPLLIVAGAGSGKTLTLAARVGRLVLAGADPARILMLTFSRRAAAEMERRVGRVLHEALGLGPMQAPPRLPWCGTFHAIGARLLRLHAARDRPRSALHGRRPRRLGGPAPSPAPAPRPGRAARAGSRRRRPAWRSTRASSTRAKPLADVLADSYPWCADAGDDLKRLFAAYAAEKQAQHVLDFDDLLVWWAEAMADPTVGAAIAARFDHVLVDEYQDTNRAPGRDRRSRSGRAARGLTVVGDDAQSIYSFRAAEVRNILDFAGALRPRRDGRSRSSRTTARRRRSWRPRTRSSSARPSATPSGSGAIGTRGERPALVWVEDEAAEASWVAERVLALRESGLALKSQAVLFRSAQHSTALELELARRDIPFVKYGGLKFLEAAHVKDVLAVLRFAANPHGQRAALARAAARAGHRRGERGAPARGDRRAAATPCARWPASRPPAAVAPAWAEFAALFAALREPGVALAAASSPRSSAGTGRCSSAGTTTPRRAPPTSPTWSGSPAATRRASASSPSSRSTRRRRPATNRARRAATRTT